MIKREAKSKSENLKCTVHIWMQTSKHTHRVFGKKKKLNVFYSDFYYDFFFCHTRSVHEKICACSYLLQRLSLTHKFHLFILKFIYYTKSQGSSPRPDIKTKYEKYFFGDFFSADIWQKLWECNKIAMKSFSKSLSFGVDFKL